jgi:single-strand DNA-binding protein
MNSINLIGRLQGDPVYFKAGEYGSCSLCKLKVGVDDIYAEDEDRLDAIDVEVYGKQADACAKFLNDGTLVGVTGSIGTDIWSTDGERTVRIWKIRAERIRFLEWPTKDEKED